MATSSIEWTDATWNPVVGCNKVSAGCKHCYAEVMHKRLQSMFIEKYRQPFNNGVQPWLPALHEPETWKKPRHIFVNSMSDLFGLSDLSYLTSVFDVMVYSAHHHTYQVLTKRAERLGEVWRLLPWKSNIWIGVTVEDRKNLTRIGHLQSVQPVMAKGTKLVRFLSLEPLLEPLGTLDLAGIGWVIVGGESGPGARPMQLDWAREIRDQCKTAGVPFFLKQLGGHPNKRGGLAAVLDGQTHTEMPNSFKAFSEVHDG